MQRYNFVSKDAVLSKTSVQDLNHSLRMLAQTTLVSSLASRKIIEVQHDRKFINKTSSGSYKFRSIIIK